MSPSARANAFLEAVSAVMPRGWSLELLGGSLKVLDPDGRSTGIGAAWLASPTLFRDDAIDEAVQTLNQIQQEIAEDTTEPWPAISGQEYRGFPGPDGAWVGDELHLWFGEESEPVLRLKPISFSDVILSD